MTDATPLAHLPYNRLPERLWTSDHRKAARADAARSSKKLRQRMAAARKQQAELLALGLPHALLWVMSPEDRRQSLRMLRAENGHAAPEAVAMWGWFVDQGRMRMLRELLSLPDWATFTREQRAAWEADWIAREWVAHQAAGAAS